MSIYKKICYKIENLFIKRMSKTDLDFKVNMDRAEEYRQKKERTKLENKKNKKKLAS